MGVKHSIDVARVLPKCPDILGVRLVSLVVMSPLPLVVMSAYEHYMGTLEVTLAVSCAVMLKSVRDVENVS